MAHYVESTLAVDGESSEFHVVGNCDIWVSNLSSGSVKLQIKFPSDGTWRDVPGEDYTEDTWKSIFVSEHGIMAKLVGVSNNADVYVRFGRFINK